MRAEEGYQHTPLAIGNAWTADPAFRAILARLACGSSSALTYEELDRRLNDFAQRVMVEVRPMADLCDLPGAEPSHRPYDEWGRRVDKLFTSEGWRLIGDWSIQNGMIGEGYGPEGQQAWLKNKDSAGGRERLKEHARLYAFAKSYLFAPDSRVSLCPTSMQDGMVKVLELYGTPAQKQRYLLHLLSRDPTTAWTAGQWMTERPGGSDVSMTETTAKRIVPLKDGEKAKGGDLYVISGFKWFSSAADGQAALALARTDPDHSRGSRGLSLFLVPIRKVDRPKLPTGYDVPDVVPNSQYNNIEVHRLKKKLGTVMVPTAELNLVAAVGELVGVEGRGVPLIASVLNITRIYSATGSASSMARASQIAQAYASVRKVGIAGQPAPGVLLSDVPLHVSRLARVSVTHRATSQLVWATAALLSRAEAGLASERQQRRLRLLTPVAKGFTATRATEVYVQCIEACGGQGYMAETPLGTILRDGTVERIWEGTPAVLSLDVARVLQQSKGKALAEFLEDSEASLRSIPTDLSSATPGVVAALQYALAEVRSTYLSPSGASLLSDARTARALFDLLGILVSGVGLLEQAAWAPSAPAGCGADVEVDAEVARRWVLGAEGGLADALREMRELAPADARTTTGPARSTQLEKRVAFAKI